MRSGTARCTRRVRRRLRRRSRVRRSRRLGRAEGASGGRRAPYSRDPLGFGGTPRRGRALRARAKSASRAPRREDREGLAPRTSERRTNERAKGRRKTEKGEKGILIVAPGKTVFLQ